VFDYILFIFIILNNTKGMSHLKAATMLLNYQHLCKYLCKLLIILFQKTVMITACIQTSECGLSSFFIPPTPAVDSE